jgi:hypothetical protein
MQRNVLHANGCQRIGLPPFSFLPCDITGYEHSFLYSTLSAAFVRGAVVDYVWKLTYKQ